MIINDNLKKNLISLKDTLEIAADRSNLTSEQLEKFIKLFEKTRYNLLTDIKLYNKNVAFDYEKIKTIDNDYKASFENSILKIYVPETMPSYKNLKTHTYKRILQNVAEITKPYKNIFKDKVFIYIKVFDNILGWDIDNKCIKPIADALIASNVIEDDNFSKMFYCAEGEYSKLPYTEIYVFDAKKIDNFLEIICSENHEK